MSQFDPAEDEVEVGAEQVEHIEEEEPVGLEDTLEPDRVAPLDPLAALERERDEYLDALRRLQAEFDNYRKRVTRQQSELLERASESLLERLLPSLDALDLATVHHGGEADGESAQLAAALGQIASLLRDTLAKEGLERIDEAEVAFDPTVHDAVAHDTDDDVEGGPHGVVVVEVLRPGYRLKGRVLRPAMVRVRG